MKLTRKNYFSPEAEAQYLGSTSFKNWDKYSQFGCEAREVAKKNGKWVEPDNAAFLLGQYVHSWASGDLQEFISEHPELFKKNSYELLAKYAVGDDMINTIKSDPAMMQMLEGEKEHVFTGEIGGVPFKIMVDILNRKKGHFADIKTTKSIREKYWNPETREWETFIQKYDYPLQFAIYAEILRQNLKTDKYPDCYILAVDKQAVPDHEIIFMDIEGFISEKLEEITLKLPRIMAVRNGEAEPERCGRCDFCRSTKKILKPIHYLDLSDVI